VPTDRPLGPALDLIDDPPVGLDEPTDPPEELGVVTAPAAADARRQDRPVDLDGVAASLQGPEPEPEAAAGDDDLSLDLANGQPSRQTALLGDDAGQGRDPAFGRRPGIEDEVAGDLGLEEARVPLDVRG
jgi:hypothetical protein